MLTPRFELRQDETQLFITIHAPYTNIKDTEVYVEGTDFRFFSMPYYLRLKLPGEIVENDDSDGVYDADKGDYHLSFSKVNKGENFENLDLITNLLAQPKKKKHFIPNIEVIENPDTNSDIICQEGENGDEWFIEQDTDFIHCKNVVNCGFANKIPFPVDYFKDFWLKDVIDLPSPSTTPIAERTTQREMNEGCKFDKEYYWADLMDPEGFDQQVLSYKPSWYTLTETDVAFSGEETDILKELPNKEFLLTNGEKKCLLLGVVDILFGSCYNERVTLGENTVESAWTINKLSSTLSWFELFTDIKQVVRACMRRSLCFPLIRNWNLSVKVFEDVKNIIKLGQKFVIKRFCEIHTLFNNSSEPRYLLNELYIKDYLIWLQKIPASAIEELYNNIADITPQKKDVGLDLIKLEEVAHSIYEESLVIENSIDGLEGDMKNLSLKNAMNSRLQNNESKSDDETSSTDSSSTSDTDSSNSSSSSSSTSSSLDSDDDSEPEDLTSKK